MSNLKKFEEEWDSFMKERESFYDRMDDKVKDFRKMVQKADRDFKLMEAEEKAIKINPKLKTIIH